MRDSISELVKFLLDDPEGFDQKRLRRAQLAIKARGETLKVLRGQCCLADWLAMEYEEGATPVQLMRLSASPARLYKSLAKLGYTWHEPLRVWRLFKNLKQPRRPKGGI